MAISETIATILIGIPFGICMLGAFAFTGWLVVGTCYYHSGCPWPEYPWLKKIFPESVWGICTRPNEMDSNV